MHCFNHRLELALKDAFEGIPAFKRCDEFITQLHLLYKNSPKRYRELKRISEAYEKSVPKPLKAYGTRWIDHKYRAMENALTNYGAYISHIESLSQTDSQISKQGELKGYLRRWKNASLPAHLAIFLDVLAPLRRLSLSFQQETHDPVKAVRRIQEFNWTMAKLQILLDTSLDEIHSQEGLITHYRKFYDSVNDEVYQNIQLQNFENVKETVSSEYSKAITNVAKSMEKRFSNLSNSIAFTNMVSLLDLSLWPKNPDNAFGDNAINDLKVFFNELLINAGCNVNLIMSEWTILKIYLFPTIANAPNNSYLETWSDIFKHNSVTSECRNVLDIFEILLVCPFTNAKVERFFSRMNRIKSDWRNQLSRDRLEVLLRISEEGPSVADFNPNPSVDEWYNDKVRRLTAGPHNYPSHQKRFKMSDSVVNLAELTLSDLEKDSSSENED